MAQQRCWAHKTADILDKMPKSVQGKAKQKENFFIFLETFQRFCIF